MGNDYTSSAFIKNCFIILIAFAFLSCAILYIYLNHKFDNTVLILQIINYVSFILWFCVCVYSNKKFVPLFIFLYQILSLIILYSYYLYYVGNSLGINPNDALFYQDLNEKIRGLSFTNAISTIWNEPRIAYSIGDIGFPVIRYCISKCFFYLGPDEINFVLLFFNAIINTLASYYLFKLARFFLNDYNSKICMILWGLSSALVWISASGLKDSIFSFFTLLSIYYMQCIIEGKKTLKNFLCFYFFLICTIFFRIFIFLFVFFTYFVRRHLEKAFFKFYVLGMIIFIVLSYVGTDIFTNIMPQLGALKMARNINLEKSFGVANLFTNTMNFCLAWVTTIPALYPQAEFRNQYVLTYSIILLYFSFFFIFTFVKILILKEKKLYPIVLILFFNIVLTIVSVVSIQYRFALPTVYLHYIVIMYLFENKDRLLRIFNKKISLGVANLVVAPVALILFVYYNLH